jgi:hypothetical protein
VAGTHPAGRVRPQAGAPQMRGMSPFLPLSAAERERQLAAYLQFLRDRDGTPDPGSRTLSRRVAYFERLASRPVRWQGALDRDAFFRNLDRRTSPQTDRKVLWLLAAAKSNRAERFGIELSMARQGKSGPPMDETRQYIEYEEFIHTRLLLDACEVFDLRFEMRPPPLLQQGIIRSLVVLPDPLALTLVLCAEVVGVVGFQVLHETADLFAEEPAVVERLRSLLSEILTDELGHVIYNRAMLDGARLAAARRVLPAVAHGLLRDLPEMVLLAGGADRFYERVERFELEAPGLPAQLAFAA